MTVETQRRLVAALAASLGGTAPAARPTEIVETHISWVILAGDFAYKLKKALDLGFLDFSSLDRRRAACEEEIRLNRRTAPDIYLDVASIGGWADAPVPGALPAIEYAVRMRRFEREDGLDFMLARGTLGRGEIEEVAAMIAAFHEGATRSRGSTHGTPDRVLEDALGNFSQMPAVSFDAETRSRLQRLRDWTLTEHARLAPLMQVRAGNGGVRECHGDLHLANMVRHDGRIVAFDCIEFNPEMRWIDVVNDLAFTLMDLRHRGHAELARTLLDTYLAARGDWEGVPLLPFYLCYRAMVRAKVAAFRAAGLPIDDPAHVAAMRDCLQHLGLAEAFTQPGTPRLLVTCGVSGSGKSYWSGAILRDRDWLRLRSDIERKRLAGLPALQASRSGLHRQLYTPAATAAVYARLAGIAEALLGAGFAVIVDATFLKRAQRRLFRDVAVRLRVPFIILALAATQRTLQERLTERAARGDDASEADHAVLAAQHAAVEPFDADESAFVISVETEIPPDMAALRSRLEAHAAPSPCDESGDR